MTKFKKTFAFAALIIAGVALASPAYAQKKMAPSMDKGMTMDGANGMMDEMNKMMKLCSKMMADMKSDHMKMNMPMDMKKMIKLCSKMMADMNSHHTKTNMPMGMKK